MTHPLAKYRADNDVSAEALAKDAGTTRQTIHRIESRAQVPSLGLVSRIVAAVEKRGGKLSADAFLLPRKKAAA